jgi:hypothetical protein
MHQVKAPDIACQLQRITAIDGRLWLHLLSYPARKAKEKRAFKCTITLLFIYSI